MSHSTPFATALALGLGVTCSAPCQDAEVASAPAAIVRFVDAFPEQADFDRPVYLDHHASDPEVYYVVCQGGLIYRIPRDGAKGDRHVFLDWSEESLAQPAFNDRSNGAGWEEGLLGFAFDPEFGDARPWVYIYYSETTGQDGTTRSGAPRLERQSVVGRLDVRWGEHGPVADPDSELRILEVTQPFSNHNGGTIVFGPDGMLYIVLGDGGAANDPYGNGQNLDTLLGSILRVDVRGASVDKPYAIPEDNPFAGQANAAVRGEIWAYGLRNPWRISFDPETGVLWCADVGQDAFEEVDRIVKGGNYGWNHREGFEPFAKRRQTDAAPDGMLPPVVTYPRSDGVSITGGYLYRGQGLDDVRGFYVYGDFQSQSVWAVDGDPAVTEPRVLALGRAPGMLASFAEEPNRELLALCFDGRIYRLLPAE